MKSRNREINIFNMSLLDILCGALGAFCFMMIVLLPYYKPDNPEDQKKQKEMEETMKKLEELKKQMPDSKLAKDMEDLIKKLQQQIKELEGRVNKLTQENKQLADKNQQLQNQNNELEKKNKEQAAEIAQLKDRNNKLQDRNNHLEMRMPGAIAAYCNEPVPGGHPSDLDICLWAPVKSVAGQSQPPFDPSLGHNPKFFNGDRSISLGGPVPMTVYMWRDLVTGIKKKLYFKLHPVEYHDKNDPGTVFPLPSPMKVNGQIMSGTPDTNIVLPEVVLTPEHPWMLVGFLEADDKDATLKFTPATLVEREAEWRALDKAPAPKP